MTATRKPRPTSKSILTKEKVYKLAREYLGHIQNAPLALEATLQVRAFNTLMDRATFKRLLAPDQVEALRAEFRAAIAAKGFPAIPSLAAKACESAHCPSVP